MASLPAFGIEWELPGEYDRLRYYGPGPEETYRDRKQGGKLGIWDATAKASMAPYLMVQETGSHEDVRWLEATDIPSDWDQASRFRMRATKAIHDHDMQPRTGLVAELEKQLEQAERAGNERPSPEQVKALALRMAEQRERAEDPTQDMNRPEPSGDEPLDLSEPEDLGESGPFEERSTPNKTKADLLREIRQRADRRTGQQEAEQRQIDPWSAQPPQRRGHGR